MGFVKGVALSYMKWGPVAGMEPHCHGALLGWDLLWESFVLWFDMFGKRVGFVKFNADVVDKATGKKVPGIVFACGPAVAVLILLESDGKTYAVLTEQLMS
ncbi:hypothetical protein LOK49_LG09G01685 [Camellia lanceoleosa]|uniref:Uncharacterized protein n=1 Tax=Camellia lanceoleosa TaxID=1840588 RepID=A0ACC0GML7_9ERIC|nr:hypothetical protein LOK49_LG09G01685 [Camellia lanceoleosa]